ncbi:SusC/RagA family TonB-linked outer membrane protein [Maribellus comscasis]|uniref:SusC/RagA family TonB-linked outer membrane protein n=1 Tax=Maribellus comscasis TaxID=2681766 RepID=A0A6I6JXZ9_9BACT|nr:SusC/RagA family TonB-linked outer membrane protein [Maribellus comscasis]QGY45042.1 SusC/RagA family TonB-linked outer membrane protein [Maribellus comscasis]
MKRNTTQSFLRNRRSGLLSKIFLIGVFLLIQFAGYAQQTKTITGNIKGTDNAPIPGVTVIIKGTTNGTVTDIDGNYTLSNVPGNATIAFSFVGLKTQEIVVGDQTSINLTMETDAIGLDEVVAIGYGTAKKQDLTGAVSSVNAEQMLKYQPANVQDMLRSAVPGLQVGYSTNARNTPDFQIRANNTIKADVDDDVNEEAEANKPLIVLDGVIFNGDIAAINVNDIASVDVLKDASAAAIYGSRASNGVIVFTTKTGTTSEPTITASAKLGIVTRGKHLDSHKAGDDVMNWLTDVFESINSLNTEAWSKFEKYEDVPSQYQSEWLTANGIPGSTDPTEITTAWLNTLGFEGNEKENYLLGRTFDWNDFLYNKVGIRQDYDLSVTGRNNYVSYYWSLGYTDNQSVTMGESFTQITSRLNLDVKATSFLNVGLKGNFSYQDEGDEPIDASVQSSSPYDAPWYNTVYNDNIPTIGKLPNKYPREYLKTAGAGSNRGNPYLDPAYTTRLYNRYRLFTTLYAKLTLPLGIQLTSNYSPRFDFRKRLLYEDSANPVWNNGGYVRRRHNQSFEYQWDNILNWSKEFGEHRFDVTGLVNKEKTQSWETDSRASNFSPTEALGFHATAFGLIPVANSSDEVVTRDALMGRINYSYSNRYNLSASWRRDGYSRFGLNKKHASFPSISAGWTLTNEGFMANRPGWLTFLKLRGSWGVNGNSSGIGSYAAYATLSQNKYLNYDGGYFIAPYLYINRMANPNLAWERNQAYNLGIDYGLWDGRVRGSIDAYTSKTNDLLLDKKLPILTGFTQITTNVGSLQNGGVDLAINTINIENSDFRWTSNFNLSYSTNKIVSLTGEKIATVDENGNTVLKEPDDTSNGWFIGKNKDIIWDYELDGIYQIGEESEAAQYGLYPGDFKYVDQDGNGTINADDKVFQGLTSPPWYMTLTNNFEYKNFDLGVILLSKLGYYGGTTQPFNNSQSYIKNHNWWDLPYWTPNNPINTAARINSINLSTARVWQSRSYLRIQNISLGYTIPSDVLEPLRIKSARIAFSADNPVVFTKWLEGDPESSTDMPSTYSFSVNISL